jgi:hypothetical protein
MRTTARYWLFAVLLLQAPLITFGQSPAKATKTPPTIISGKVTIKDKPAQGVIVMLRRSDVFSNQFENLPRGTTTADGTYQIVGVPPGSFEVTPSAPAYVASAGQKNRTVVVGEGELIENINFSLVKGGVITGKVVDADARPLVAQLVNLFRAEAFEQRPPQGAQTPQRSNPVSPSGSATTDDRGVYRLFGLAAGRYKVAVGRSDETYNLNVSPSRATFLQVFHPDVNDQAKATIIEVSEGSETTNVDITMGRPIQTYSASGRVVDGETGAPMPGIRFGLQRMRPDRPEFFPSIAVTTSQGEFIFEGLINGKYSAVIMPEPNNELRADPVTFDLLDQDVSGLTVRMNKGASISGVVIVDNDNKGSAALLATRRVNTFVQSPNNLGGLGQNSSSAIAPDGTFRLGGLPAGTAFINVSNPQGDIDNKGFVLLRIERDGVVQPRGVEIRDGENLTGLKAVVSFGSATLRGVIKVNGEVPENASYFIRLTRGGEPLSTLRPTRVDARGRFMVEGLPPGQYEISATVMSPTARSIKPGTQQVSVQDGSVAEVEIMVELTAVQPRP